MLHFGALLQMVDLQLDSHRLRNSSRNLVDRENRVGSDIENPVVSSFLKHRPGDDRCHFADVTKGPALFSVAKNRQGLSLHDLINKDTDHVSISVIQILSFSKNIMRSKNDVV